MKIQPGHIILSRTDSIGDVMLTLPMCGYIKRQWPQCKITFVGRSYTQAVIECCEHVDHFVNWDLQEKTSLQDRIDGLRSLGADAIIHVFPHKEIVWLAKKAGIPWRVATGRRLFTLMKCNKPVFFTRKGSDLHEAQLNMKLLQPFGVTTIPELQEISDLYGFSAPSIALPNECWAGSNGKRIILHPFSKGSAVNWDLAHYRRLVELLEAEDTQVFLTGTKVEGDRWEQLGGLGGKKVVSLAGKLTLPQMIAFTATCDGLVAASTGPLHIAAALGKKAIGLYTPKRPMHPGRWAPIGKHAVALVADSHPEAGVSLKIPAERVFATWQA
jgi:heptosyltransferase III